MDTVIYLSVLALVKLIQSLPLLWVARLGRAAGGLAYRIDRRHRKVAIANLTAVFGSEKSSEAINELAHENFRRLGENYCSAVKTASMSWDQLQAHCHFIDEAKLYPNGSQPERLVVAIGHFGNFELYARFSDYLPGLQCATTYRGITPESLNRILLDLRQRSNCRFFERRTEGHQLKNFMQNRRVMLGLLADQHAGRSGLWLPFFGRDCSTSPAPAVFALRYDCLLYTGICFRVGLAQWRIEVGDLIPLQENGHRRATEAIMRDVNQAFEAGIRRDPANWFWVHKRWKPRLSAAAKREEPVVAAEL